MTVNVVNGAMEAKEIAYYANHIRRNNPGMDIDTMTLTICEDGYIDASYSLHPVPFERIRRITGYLVGTLDLFNDAKQAEERDRVKHVNTGRTCE